MGILPGQTRPLSENQMCEVHDDKPAVIELCTEADSFGAEWTPLCQSCIDEHNAEKHPDGVLRDCDWCHATNVRIKPMRDYEEGSNGPVYDVCGPCRTRHNKRVQEELEASGYYDD